MNLWRDVVYPPVVIGLNAVVVAVTEETPRILTVRATGGAAHEPSLSGSPDAIPFGQFDPGSDRTLELGLRRWVREQTGLNLGYVEQLYTFGDRNRDPAEGEGGPRVVSVAYLALVREGKPSGRGGARWCEWYRFFPWEDWRCGRPGIIDKHIAPALSRWSESAPDSRILQDRRERSDINFGLGGAPWVPERALERYELVYEVNLAFESLRDREPESPASPGARRGNRMRVPDPTAGRISRMGDPMALDHRRILATALGRLRGKLKYRPVVFELLPPAFTLFQLQRVVEALAGVRLHKQNFRRLVEKGGLVEGTARYDRRTGGRPAELFRFRREVLRERPAPGVGLPGIKKQPAAGAHRKDERRM
ncbi:MAG: hypothetical protein JW793_12270 [Acidobacteria bacterium]|nr:hypothetical protein [Acidobacteriota bacterium]